MRSLFALLRDSAAARVVGVAVVVAMTVSAGFGVQRLLSDDPAADAPAADLPPPLTPRMIKVLQDQGLYVVPDDSGTRDRAEDVQTIVGRYGATTDGNPERELTGVSLARVTDRDDDRLRDSLRWVVFFDGVLSQCFGGDMCGDDRVLAREVKLLDPDSLDWLSAVVF